MTSLVDRYVAATNDGFPDRNQAEVEREVREALEDIVEAHVNQGMTEDAAERAAIEEVGEPKAFAEQFRKHKRYLIGPEQFPVWWAVVRWIVFLATPLIMVATLIGEITNENASAGKIVAATLATGFQTGVQLVFWVTLAFALNIKFGLDTSKAEEYAAASAWSVDDLPEITTGRQIHTAELVGQITILSLLMGFVYRLATDNWGAFGLNRWLDLPADLPVFNPDLSPIWFWGLFFLVILNILVSVWSFIGGYWTQRVLIVTVILNVLWIAYFVVLATVGDIVNPDVRTYRSGQGEWSLIGTNSNNIIVAIIVLISLWDIWEAVGGHLAYRRQRGGGALV